MRKGTGDGILDAHTHGSLWMNSGERQYPRDALGLRPKDEPWGQLIDTLFFASLGTEEGEPTRSGLSTTRKASRKLRTVRDAVPVGGGYIMRAAWEVIPLEAKDGITKLSVEDLIKIAPAVALPRAFVVVGLDADSQLVVQGLVSCPGNSLNARSALCNELHHEEGRDDRCGVDGGGA